MLIRITNKMIKIYFENAVNLVINIAIQLSFFNFLKYFAFSFKLKFYFVFFNCFDMLISKLNFKKKNIF
jgi:hypothetical protein